MGIVNYTYNRTTSGGEIIRELVNASDGQGLHFDGVAGTYVNCGDSAILDSATRFSVEVIASTSSSTEEVLVGKRWNYECFALYNNAAGNILFKVNNGSSTASATSSGVYNDGDPHHVVATWDNATLSIYVNGNLDGTATLAGGSLPNTDDKLALGAQVNNSLGNNANLDGVLYRARLWNKALSSTEIKDSYDNPSVKFADQYGVEPAQNVSTCVNGSNPYTSFTSASATGFTAIQVGATASEAGTADEIALVNGKSYRVSFYIGNTSQAPRVSFADSLTGTVQQELVGLATLTTGTQTYDITYTGTTTTGVLKFDTTAAASYVISNLSITRVGVVADYDLAFANTTQSLTVQDRAGVADGTASASGVTQVTPIEQLNAKAARIGTSAATPADGELFADAVVVGDGTANQNWVRVHSVAAQIPGVKLFRGSGDSSDASNNNFGMLVTDSGFEVSKFTDGGANITGRVPFLTIDSDGRVLIGTSTEGEATADNLTIADTGHCGITLRSGTGSVGTLFFSDGTSGADEYRGYVQYDHSGNFLKWATDGEERMRIDSFGNVNIPGLSASSDVQTDGSKNLITSSDKRLKNDIGELTAGLDIVGNLQPHYFSWKNDKSNTRQLGFFAQDVYEFLPEAAPREQKQSLVTPAVAAEPATYYEEGDELPEGKSVGDEKTAAVDAVDAVYELATLDDGSPDYEWGFNGRPIIAALVAAVKELKAKVETLENA